MNRIGLTDVMQQILVSFTCVCDIIFSDRWLATPGSQEKNSVCIQLCGNGLLKDYNYIYQYIIA